MSKTHTFICDKKKTFNQTRIMLSSSFVSFRLKKKDDKKPKKTRYHFLRSFWLGVIILCPYQVPDVDREKCGFKKKKTKKKVF